MQVEKIAQLDQNRFDGVLSDVVEALEKGIIKNGDRIVFVGFGAGLTWGALAAQWTGPLPVELVGVQTEAYPSMAYALAGRGDPVPGHRQAPLRKDDDGLARLDQELSLPSHRWFGKAVDLTDAAARAGHVRHPLPAQIFCHQGVDQVAGFAYRAHLNSLLNSLKI